MPHNNKPALWTKDFLLLGFGNLVMAIAFYLLIPTLPLYIVNQLGADKSHAGLILASYTLAALMIRPFAGYAIDNYGRKSIYLISFLLFSLLFSGYLFASSIILLLMLRFTHGLTWGVTSTSGSTIAVDIIPASRRGEGIGIYGLNMTIAMAIGPLIGLFLIGDGSYHNLFISAALISMAGFLLVMMVRYPAYQPVKSNFSWRQLIDKTSLPASLNTMLLMISYGGVISFAALYGKDIGIKYPGPFFLVFAMGIAISRVISGRIFDQKGPKLLMISGIIMLIAGYLVLALYKNPSGYYIASFILGLGNGIIMPTFQAMVNSMVQPSRRGIANSTLFTAFDLGIGTGMAATGILSDMIGLPATFMVCSVICAISLVHFAFVVIVHYERNKLLQ